MTDAPGIGHNSGVSLYVSDIGKLQAIDAVLKNPAFSQTEALVLIGLIVRSDKAYGNAFPGASTLAVYAKVAKTETVFKALRNLEDHYEMVERASRGNGRSNSYTVIPQRVVDAIVKEYDERKRATHPADGGGPPTEPTPLNGAALPQTHSVERGGFLNGAAPLNGVGHNQNPPRSTEPRSTGHPVQGGATHPVQRGTYPSHDTPQEELASGNRFVPVNLAGLNGAAEPMLNDILGWMSGGDVTSARNWLSKFIHIHGQDVVRDSYQKLSTDMISGSIITQPLQTWGRIASRLRQERKTGADHQKAAPVESAGDKIRKFAEEAEERQRQNKRVRP